MMLNLTRDNLILDPFPHVTSNEILDPALYAKLRADFPTADIFEAQKSSTGLEGSRTGQGFDIYRGDMAYDALVSNSAPWRMFDEFINSGEFVELFLDIFGDRLNELGCSAQISPNRYNREYIEPRAYMTNKATLSERLSNLKSRIIPRERKGTSAELFTRLDIHKALSGYEKKVHCDRPNRLCSLIVYFCDADKIGLQGGYLTVHKHRQSKSMENYERHPKPEDAPVVATIKPEENMGIFFPCCNNSYHGVTKMENNNIERDYLYINISTVSENLW